VVSSRLLALVASGRPDGSDTYTISPGVSVGSLDSLAKIVRGELA